MTDRKKPGVAFWATVAVVAMLIGDPLSFGPACRVTSRMTYPHAIFETTYQPLAWNAEKIGQPSWLILNRYAQLGMPPNHVLLHGGQPVTILIWSDPPLRRSHLRRHPRHVGQSKV